MAAAPSHYIRSIHTSFTAAHPHSSSAWATAASVSRHTNHLSNLAALNNLGHPLQGQFTYNRNEHREQPNYSPSINSHNAQFYTHHLQNLSYPSHTPQLQHHHHYQLSNGQYVSIPSSKVGGVRSLTSTSTASSGTKGRRRSVSIRVPPPSLLPSQALPQQTYKFDPFSDEPAVSLAGQAELPAVPLSSSSQANRSVSLEHEDTPVHPGGPPYTIHIPAAQPTDILRYSPPPPRSPRPMSRSLTPKPKPAMLVSLGPVSAPSVSPTDTVSANTERPQTSTGPNLSKIVAGILLNRVHAVGKPMRRRVLPPKGQAYRKSCLSSVVSVVEA